MSEHGAGKLRIYADFNSCTGDDRGVWCWLLRYDGKLLDGVAASLDFYEGMSVTLYYKDEDEEFEVNAVLGCTSELGETKWMALPDWTTLRRLRG